VNTATIPTADSSFAEKVAFGAAELDRVRPNWFQEIDTTILDLFSNFTCILGQLYGTYGAGRFANDWEGEDAVLRGFVVLCSDKYNCFCDRQEAALRGLWKAEISARKDANK
jgi:hypothetical protein